jgi:hypothetical protein
MGQNATYLTKNYPGKERELWNPCIIEFFRKHKPMLPISVCIDNPTATGPWFKSRPQFGELSVEGKILEEGQDFLEEIGAMFGKNLKGPPNGRITETGNIAGIEPDIIIMSNQVVYIVEVKPYDSSSFTGNQEAGKGKGAYLKFVKWINEKKNIPCEYLVIMSVGCNNSLYKGVVELQKELKEHFWLLLLEDIFSKMDEENYKYRYVKEEWREYTDKDIDYSFT